MNENGKKYLDNLGRYKTERRADELEKTSASNTAFWMFIAAIAKQSFLEIFYFSHRPILKIIFFLLYRLKTAGVKDIPKRGPLIIVMNHQSYLDPPILAAMCPRQVHYMVHEEVYNVPVLHTWIKLMGSFPVAQGVRSISAFREALKLLKKGEVVGIFPEGGILLTQYKDVDEAEVIGSAYAGMIRLAIRGKAPILPVGISGSGRALPKESIPMLKKIPRFTKIKIHYGKPISLKEYYRKKLDNNTLNDLTEKITLNIKRLIN
ncbi:lysophospholipid acyltransferase family protein [Elusimicrobiota bacterium]